MELQAGAFAIPHRAVLNDKVQAREQFGKARKLGNKQPIAMQSSHDESGQPIGLAKQAATSKRHCEGNNEGCVWEQGREPLPSQLAKQAKALPLFGAPQSQDSRPAVLVAQCRMREGSVQTARARLAEGDRGYFALCKVTHCRVQAGGAGAATMRRYSAVGGTGM